ncbi:MAG: dimethyl sulfoxide reductase anchor subunit [Verrucomicrobiales bacterium]|nr:dimethyl sulfoxide reductase anchor subunit [Verrucomicrobiales bacterium]
MPPVAPTLNPAPTFLDELLAQERDLTAVERFSRWHGRQTRSVGNPAADREHTYRQWLPRTAPRPGEQHAFEVDLDRCSGCKACVTACHSLNGLEEGESWRSVGLLIGTPKTRSPALASVQHVTTACHHCVEPACQHGCPVLAYDKDPVTGIVRHLDDQCIGCTYCVMMCPYEVPRYSARLGIVRKCDMCSGRLAAGEPPACVQACPTEAIRITNVSQNDVRSRLTSSPASPKVPIPNPFLPTSPAPGITFPTTRYLSQRGDLSQLKAVDLAEAEPAHAHTPLVFMLVLTQIATGIYSWLPWIGAEQRFAAALAGLVALLAGMGASALHLGQPLRAWRVFLGLRRSWLSREAVLFGLMLPLALASVFLAHGSVVGTVVAATTGLIGWLSVLASTMVYAATRRAPWSIGFTLPRFAGSVLACGTAVLAAVLPADTLPSLALPTLITAGLGLSLAAENRLFRHRNTTTTDALSRSARIMAGPLRRFTWARLGFAGAGWFLTVAPSAGLPGAHSPWVPVLAGGLLIVSALLERHLFFTAASPDRMPGNVPA